MAEERAALGDSDGFARDMANAEAVLASRQDHWYGPRDTAELSAIRAPASYSSAATLTQPRRCLGPWSACAQTRSTGAGWSPKIETEHSPRCSASLGA